MAMKELLYRLRPMQIYIVLALSIAYFVMQLFLSHITHALTLLVASYHMLCNIVALSGCIITIKHCNDQSNRNSNSSISNSDDGGNSKGNFPSIFTKSTKTSTDNKFIEVNEAEAHRHERSLRNTFGWMRIEILTMLIAGIFLGAFCFSLVVEAIQTLVHIDHQDTMHLPVVVFSLSVGGLVLNLFCYIMIGGYTYHQGRFLHITSSGDVVLDEMANEEGRLCRSNGRLSKTKRTENTQSNTAIQSTGSSIQIDTTASASAKHSPTNNVTVRTHSFAELIRDISSTLFVMICSVIVYFADNENVTKYVDPIISIVSGITLLILSFPYMKESCLILLQTIPASIDIEVFKSDLLQKFDDIVSVHDLHIWQMTSSKFVSTVHILFHNPMVYVKIKDEVVNFFHAQGITIVTIQPEFKTKSTNEEKSSKCQNSWQQCLIGCQSIECAPKTCCSTNDLDAILIGDAGKKSKKSKKSKTERKSNSMLSLNVSSLGKLRKFAGSTQDIIKKSVSESHVTQMGCDDSIDSPINVSKTPSTANNLYSVHNSIDELAEKEFHDQCDARSEQRLPPNDQKSQKQQCESNGEHEDSTLLNKDCRPSSTTQLSSSPNVEQSAQDTNQTK